MMVGGAAVAQAQGSLGSLMPTADVGLTVAVDDEGAVGGTLTNNTEEALTCDVNAADAELIEEVQALVADGNDLADALDEAGFEGNGGTAENVEVDAEDAADWAIENPEVDDDFVAGAVADCGEEVDPAFAYESGGLFGSLDLGSLDLGGSLDS